MQVPLLCTTAVQAPYLSPDQTPGVTKAINALVRQMPVTTAQRQSVRARIVIVRTVPLNVRCTFESAANKQALQSGKPPCTCSPDTLRVWAAAGTVGHIRGHFCLLPIAIRHNGTTLRITDPLPLPGNKSYRAAVSSLQQLAKTSNLYVSPVSNTYPQTHLPATLFPETGALRQHVRQITTALAPHAVIRVVDKGPLGVLQGVGVGRTSGIHTPARLHQGIRHPGCIFQSIQNLAGQRGWSVNPWARLALLYLIRKAKSSTHIEILWRPIVVAPPPPVIARSRLRVAPEHSRVSSVL